MKNILIIVSVILVAITFLLSVVINILYRKSKLNTKTLIIITNIYMILTIITFITCIVAIIYNFIKN